jgi:hypothetical protein
MSLSSTSNSDQRGWRRLWREVGRLLALLLILELVLRVEPIKTMLSDALDPYENLLWYSEYMPAYREQLTNGPHYDLWMVGSSYMMTGLQPEWVQRALENQGVSGTTVQNYGMPDMVNFFDMAAIFDRWILEMDQPKYAVINISVFNFSARTPSIARNSPMERTLIFPDSPDDYVAGWLFQNSRIYRYALLARNASFIPRSEAELKPHPLGGFIEGPTPFMDCDPTEWKTPDDPQISYPPGAFDPIDRFIEVIQKREIPLVIVDMPLQYCNMRRFFVSETSYKTVYLTAITAHLQQKGIPFLNLAGIFYREVPDNEQYLYFLDRHHPNLEGARLFSQWTGEFLAEWLQTQP